MTTDEGRMTFDLIVYLKPRSGFLSSDDFPPDDWYICQAADLPVPGGVQIVAVLDRKGTNTITKQASVLSDLDKSHDAIKIQRAVERWAEGQAGTCWFCGRHFENVKRAELGQAVVRVKDDHTVAVHCSKHPIGTKKP